MEPTASLVKPLEGDLSEQALFLAPLAESLTTRWAKLYLNTLGRGSFFSAHRVEKIFKELTEIFIRCLKEANLDSYFQTLKEKGGLFSRLGVPFEEVIISLHLFEEACLEEFIESYPYRAKLPALLGAMEELHRQGLATLAGSYFETVKKEMQGITESLREENESLRSELTRATDSIFTLTQKELTSMQLMISSINQKLRNRVYQLSRLQRMSDALDNVSHLPKLLKVASLQLQSLCPANSCVFFGFFDEKRQKVNIHRLESREAAECEPVKTFYFSELSKSFQDALYDESKRCTHLASSDEVPEVLRSLIALRNQLEFLVMPLRKYNDISGFIFLSTSIENFFSKSHHKFYERIAQVLSKALLNASLIERSHRQDQLSFLLEELSQKNLAEKPFETTLDFCLGSLIELLGAERSSLMRFDEAKKELRVYAAKGAKVYPISGLSIRWGEGIAGLALKESKIIAISKMKEPPHSFAWSRFFGRCASSEIKVKSLLCLPLFESAKPLGVVNVSTINFHKNFDPSEIEMAHHLVNRIAHLVKSLPE